MKRGLHVRRFLALRRRAGCQLAWTSATELPADCCSRPEILVMVRDSGRAIIGRPATMAAPMATSWAECAPAFGRGASRANMV